MFGVVPKSMRQHAAALTPLTHGAAEEQVEAFLASALGPRGGGGLQAVVEADEAAGQIFGAAFALEMLCGIATVNQPNCAKLGALGRDILLVLDAAGRKGTKINSAMLGALASCLDDCCALVDGFSQPGWLLRVACNEQMREEFATLHEAAEEILKSDGLAALPGGRPMPRADYQNLTKAVRRLLKQLGRGSVTAGVVAVRDPESVAAKELAGLLEVTPAQVAAEAVRVPESGLDIDTLYRSLLAGGPGFAGAMAGAGAEAGAARASNYADMFEWYDADKSGAIELPELHRVLADLGMLEGKTPREAAACAENHMRAADAAGAGKLGRDAFARWCGTLVMNKARQHLRFKMGLQAEEDLRNVFVAFSSFGCREEVREMDGKAFIKLARDTELLGGALTPTEVDLIFARVKSKGARRVGFEQFLTALSAVAEKKGVSFEAVVSQVLSAGGPIAHATKADNVRLHDDRSTYTGVYARGGPTAVDDVFSLASFLDRDRAAPGAAAPGSASKDRATPGRAAGAVRVQTPGSSRRASMAGGAATPLPGGGAASRRESAVGEEPANALREVFTSFAKFGIRDDARATPPAAAASGTLGSTPRPPAPARRFDTNAATPGSVGKGPATPGAVTMDGFRFAKLCREAGLVDGRKLTPTGVDLIFTKAKARGAKKIGFEEFSHALHMLAEAMGTEAASIAAAIEGCGGPAVGSATTPDAVRFYDDARRTPARQNC
ncbi:hypothetical protein Rsub_03168 [Raphidocelis subcapitata]|uniref:EF-hand domain-containing protein n=1 Tax=Raphidocelis subcapitata TaxID=307507 RepID=A0A2V0NSI6_9CHLO|nr:hypothetical protein Rsub_03168 [Raphidocelis subcapitata]|eukprot:GBF90596.1 hypothetical protein Rsub_03168 [Raphidocelis subcapitata]